MTRLPGVRIAELLEAGDLAAFAPAAALAPAVGGSARRGLHVLRRDDGKHPSPDAGRCEAAFAGVLGVRLGGVNVYGGRAESRAFLGDGPPPGPRDIRRAVTLSHLVTAAAAVLAALAAASPGSAAAGGDRR